MSAASSLNDARTSFSILLEVLRQEQAAGSWLRRRAKARLLTKYSQAASPRPSGLVALSDYLHLDIRINIRLLPEPFWGI